MKKTLLVLLSALFLTGCTTGADMTTITSEPTASPTMQPTTVPTAQPTDGMTDGAMDSTMDGIMDGVDGMTDGLTPGTMSTDVPESTGVTSIRKVENIIEQVEDELERLSEVDDAQVILAGNKAAVALEFDDQYKAGIDDRLRGIVKERIDSVISGISTIAITADETLMDAIEALGDSLSSVSDMAALQRDVDALIKKIGTK